MILEPRLLAVAKEIYSNIHLDIGSDHALLPKYLLEHRHIKLAIVIEKNLEPYHNAKYTLRQLSAKVLLGDGLEPLDCPVDSLSITGMGAKHMVAILSKHPGKLPKTLVLQSNDSAEPIRKWSLGKYHLVNEQMVKGFWNYEILKLTKNPTPDPCYKALGLEVALRFGPILLEQKHPLLQQELEKQCNRLSKLKQTSKVLSDLSIVKNALEVFHE
jgi:tRNA (adenine22-N1)-methyltransferase